MQIELGHDIRSRLRKALRQAGCREIGGMIFAEQLAPAHFRVMDFSLDAHSGSHTMFNRDPDVHRQALDDFFRRTGQDFTRFNYLGEWHSHPSFSVGVTSRARGNVPGWKGVVGALPGWPGHG